MYLINYKMIAKKGLNSDFSHEGFSLSLKAILFCMWESQIKIISKFTPDISLFYLIG